MTDLSRRNFITLATNTLLAAGGLLVVGVMFRFLSEAPETDAPAEMDLGLAVNYPPGSRTVVKEVPAVLAHTENGYTALSLTCTHLGCVLEKEAGSFTCPCHGSRFAEDGTVQHGPASQALASIPIQETNTGHLVITGIER